MQQPGVRYRLVVRRGPQPNHQYDLNRDTVTIGRDITNDIVINDPEVSRHHARIVRTASGIELEDLRSTNGTFINHHRITGPHPLANGDTVGLGETVLLAFEAVGSAVAPTLVGTAAQSQPAPAPQSPQQQVPPVRPQSPPVSYTAPPQAPPEYDAPASSSDDRNRWVVIGCAGMTLIFCCAVVVAAIVIDQQNLYCSIPLMKDISFFCLP